MELGNDQQPQLYDLSSDPSEKTNVAKQHPDIVKELAELLESVKRNKYTGITELYDFIPILNHSIHRRERKLHTFVTEKR